MKYLVVLMLSLLACSAWGATCTVTEFVRLPQDPGGNVLDLGTLPPVASQRVTYTTSTQSTAFNAVSNFIRIQCDAAAHFAVGANPTATVQDPRIPGGGVEYFFLSSRGVEIAFYDGTS